MPYRNQKTMNEEPIANRIEQVRERMARAAARRGVPAESVVLLGVTKTVDAARIRAAYEAGIRDFGENYVQEALTKVGDPDLSFPDTRWHFIGHLQRNKAREVAGRFALVQSVDSVELARELAKRELAKGREARLLLEVRLDEAGTKFGLAPETVLETAQKIGKIPGVKVQGLMALAPFSADPEDARPHFRKLYTVYAALPDVMRQTLSMGMTGDFEVAIEEGANLVRLGTAIFGPRQPRKE